ncbi:MAG: NADPH:quinone oxidoreductase family protein, partial [Woeseiaceae bacterium]
FADLLMIAGKYQVKPPLPFSPGFELAGDVIEVAGDIEGIEPGQRVVAAAYFGGMAEQICLEARRVVALPDAIDYVTAAAFLIAYGTAYHALKQRAGLQSGETLAVLGAAGGVGLATVEIGKLMGATVIAAASSADKLDLAAEYGADHLVNYTDTGLKDGINEITAGKGADVILDPVGGELFEQCLRALAWGGRVLVIGFTSGRIPKVPANLPLLKGSAIVGVFWGRFADEDPEKHAANTAHLFRLLDAGKLKPYVSATYALQESAEALEKLATRRAKGRIVVTV